MPIYANPLDSAVELWDELSEEIWQVKQGAEEPCLMSLGEMDLAMQRGTIDATALVCRVGTNDWRSLAAIAGIDPSIAAFPSFAGELPAHTTAPRVVLAAPDDSDSLLPVASSIDVTDAPDVDLQLDFDLAASPVPAVLFVPDAFGTGSLRYAGGSHAAPRRRSSGIARHALGAAAMVATFGVVFVGISAFLANTYGGGKADAAFVVSTRAPVLAPVAFEIPEPRLAEPRAAVPSASAPEPAAAPTVSPIVEPEVAPAPALVAAPVKQAPRPVVVAAPVAQKPAGVAISASERAWDSRKAVHKR